MKNTNIYHIIYTSKGVAYLDIITTVKSEEDGKTCLTPLEYRVDTLDWANRGVITIETKNLVPGKRVVSESHIVECKIIGDVSELPEYLL